MLEKIKKWLDKKEREGMLITKGKLMYHKKEKLTGDEDWLIQKGYYKAEREELRTIERLNRAKELNNKMKVTQGKKVTLSDSPFKPKPKRKTRSIPAKMEIKW